MDRRDFLKLASAAGISVVSPVVYGEYGIKDEPRTTEAYGGNLYLFVNAGGGWDVTSLCDPKGAAYEDDPERMNNYLKDDIGEAGNIRYAPMGYNETFFQKYYDRLLVVNNIDMQTNGHDQGNRHTWSGRLSEGYPSMAAFMAGAYGPEMPLAFLSFGAYSETAGIVARTRSGNINVLQRLAYPSRMNPDDENSEFHSAVASEYLVRAQKDREVALLERQNLPRIRQAMSTLFTSRAGSNELRKLQEYLPETFSDNPIGEQAQLAIAAFRAGVCVSANLSTGGFDTHGNNDDGQTNALTRLLEGIDVALTEAEAQGVADRVFIAVGSDFGRTPGYNDGNGKDHWSVSSMMFIGAGVPGNRVIGETTDRHNLKGMNLDNLTVNDTPDAPRLRPGNVCQAIRRLSGLDQSELSAMFPIEEQYVPLFG
ncbi:DUF1501 domain-containing protein [Paraliomyxa miuraensis]|uniref:DUF1501 domain-containing protein n=1 Tax=Paraliomyxa miuraensis TaxID=376150 RepID=UPI00224DF852|nr:DUF1501 domain-containing protein [Paraliomyxa miuraensis]MCX4246133.1 DUF1501 domain-containing protein [Paraliomyxa miuraensis]